jgi:hypothetical protein
MGEANNWSIRSLLKADLLRTVRRDYLRIGRGTRAEHGVLDGRPKEKALRRTRQRAQFVGKVGLKGFEPSTCRRGDRSIPAE